MSQKANPNPWAAVAAALVVLLAASSPAAARDDNDGRQRWGQTRNFEHKYEHKREWQHERRHEQDRYRHFDQRRQDHYWRHSHRSWHPHNWHAGHWHQGWVDGRHGWWWVVGSLYYGYPAPLYPYPVDHQASIIINLPPLIIR